MLVALIYSLRPKHWIKNLFIFMPLVFGQKLLNQQALFAAAITFILFSLAASSVYLFNDILDSEKDRLHRVKKLRPIASGKISKHQALIAALFLGIFVLVFSSFFNARLGIILLTYLLMNVIYSKWLKEMVILDVFTISFFFFLRISAGTVVAEVAYSHWMIFMVVLLALFLGFNKRRQELLTAEKEAGAQRAVLSKYSLYFIDQMISVLTSSIVVVYLLYTIDERTVREFGTNHLMYTIPFVYYGIFRYLYLIHKRRQAEDPVVVVTSDRMMQVNLLLWMAVSIGVIYFGI